MLRQKWEFTYTASELAGDICRHIERQSADRIQRYWVSGFSESAASRRNGESMKTQYPTDDDTKRAAANRSTEMQKLIGDFHKQIGKALCQNQNRNVRTQHRSHLQLIGKR